jgi:RNA 3'-phosphate cyclase
MNNDNILKIDGSFGEGGGSILRLSAAFSILYNRAINFRNIRANRAQPGLRMQHLLGLKTLAEITKSKLSKCEVGSTEITFIPQREKLKDTFEVNVNTAASVGLLLQPIQIACLKYNHPEKLIIRINGGGTFGQWAPSLNYLSNVTYPIYKRSGLSIDLDVRKYGFYPKGGANTLCAITLPKVNLKPIVLTEMGTIKKIQGEIIITSHLKKATSNIGNRIQNTITSEIKRYLGFDTDIKIQYVDSLSPGVGLCLWAHSNKGSIISSGTILGEKNISSETLGKTASQMMIKYIENQIPVDNYLSDQLIPLMAYVDGSSKIRVLEITSHTKTNLDLIQMFTNRKYHIFENEKSCLIEFES